MDGYQYATILAALVAPQSRGNVTLNSKDAKTLPTINMAYLQSPTDQKVAIAAFKRVREAFASKFMKGTVIGPEYYPGLKVDTDEEILQVRKSTAFTPFAFCFSLQARNIPMNNDLQLTLGQITDN